MHENTIMMALIASCLFLAVCIPFASGNPDEGGFDVAINPENSPPVADFIWAVNEKKVTFTDLSTDNSGGIVSWNWSFDDGEYSGNQDPVHFYTDFGEYNVTLNVTDEWGAYNNTTKTIDVSSDTYPFEPLLISPVHNCVDAGVNPELRVKVYDPDGDQLTVQYYNASGVLIDSFTGMSDNIASIIWRDRELGETYEWYCTVSDGSHTVTSDTWRFTVNSYDLETNYVIPIIGVSLLIGFAGISEYTHHQYRPRKGTILFAFVGLISLGLCFMPEIQQYQWLLIIFILITIVYWLRAWLFRRGESP